jgi:diphthamide synthase (EF-2-diphthine--ammonia ligase)
MPIVRIDNVEEFVGMELAKAQKEIIARGYDARLVHVDKNTLVHESLIGSRVDYDPLRVNLHVKAGYIVKAFIA